MPLLPAQFEAIKSTFNQCWLSEHAGSDWDIATRWSLSMTGEEKLIKTELLRQDLRHALQVQEDQIDLIDIDDARLAMCALVAQEGLELYIGNKLAWVQFLLNPIPSHHD
jgi:hypothetical protein